MSLRPFPLALAAALSLALLSIGMWRWVHAPPIKVRCPNGERPQEATVSAVLGVGHGAMGTVLVLSPGRLKAKSLWGEEIEREFSAEQTEELMARLERPRAWTQLGEAEAKVSISYRCPRGERSLELSGEVGQQHPDLSSWVRAPLNFDVLLAAAAGTLRDLDPRPRKVVASSLEAISISEPLLKDSGTAWQ